MARRRSGREAAHAEPERRAGAPDRRSASRALSLQDGARSVPPRPAQEGHAGIGPLTCTRLQDRIGVAQARAQAPGERDRRDALRAQARVVEMLGQASRLIDQGVDPVEHGIEDIAAKRSVRRRRRRPPRSLRPSSSRIGR